MKVIVCGSRGWHDAPCIKTMLEAYIDIARRNGEELVVVHGDAPKGADRLADGIARRLGLEVIPEPADWTRYGKPAGFIRNQRILDTHPDAQLVLAFRSKGKSNGTDDMCERAEGAGRHVLVVADDIDD